MIGDNIKKYRTERKMTQKDLADRLYVTAQAVSRWENGDVEPSLSTVAEIAKIFEVTCDDIIGVAAPKAEETSAQPPETPEEEAPAAPVTIVVNKEDKPVLAVCERCNRPIYNGDEIVRHSYHSRIPGRSTENVVCKECEEKQAAAHRKATVAKMNRRRKLSYWLGGLAFAAFLLAGLVMYSDGKDASDLIYCIVGGVAAFTLISCCLLCNNFIGDVIETISLWGFRTMPGVIFSLDLEGIIWLITVKLLFWILGLILMIGAEILAVIVGGFLSLFVYPFAIVKSYKRPEENDFLTI